MEVRVTTGVMAFILSCVTGTWSDTVDCISTALILEVLLELLLNSLLHFLVQKLDWFQSPISLST